MRPRFDWLNSVLIPFVSVIFGGVLTWVSAWWYYKKAGDELRAEASQLRRHLEAILRLQELLEKDTRAIRDAEGRPTGGLLHHAEIAESAKVTDSEDATVIPAGTKPGSA